MNSVSAPGTYKSGDLCPECEQLGLTRKLRFFYINLNDRIIKCENNECLYPHNDEVSSDDEDDVDINAILESFINEEVNTGNLDESSDLIRQNNKDNADILGHNQSTNITGIDQAINVESISNTSANSNTTTTIITTTTSSDVKEAVGEPIGRNESNNSKLRILDYFDAINAHTKAVQQRKEVVQRDLVKKRKQCRKRSQLIDIETAAMGTAEDPTNTTTNAFQELLTLMKKKTNLPIAK